MHKGLEVADPHELAAVSDHLGGTRTRSSMMSLSACRPVSFPVNAAVKTARRSARECRVADLIDLSRASIASRDELAEAATADWTSSEDGTGN